MSDISLRYEEREGIGKFLIGSVYSQSVSKDDTITVYKKDYMGVVLRIKTDAAVDVTLDSVAGNLEVPEAGVNTFFNVGETIASFAGAGETVVNLADALTKRWAVAFPYLRFKFSAAATIDFVATATTDISSISALRDALKPARTEATQVFSAKSISASSTENIDMSGLDGYSAVIMIVKATYDGSATAGVRVRWLYSPDGSNFDSTEEAEDAGNYEDMTFSAGATRQRTVLVPVFSDNMRIQIVNQDGSKAVTVDVWKILLH